MSKIPCEMIQDILPLYVDGLTSETTDQEIRQHLDTCESCKDVYEAMSDEPELAGGLNDLPEIEYLKQVKRKNLKRVVGAVLAVFLLGAALLFAKYFVIGVPVGEYFVAVTAEEDTLLIEGTILDSALVYSHYRIEEGDGEKKLVVYGRLSSFVGGTSSFSLTLPWDYEQTLVVNNGVSVLPNDTVIDKQTKLLFEAKNLYIGDMSANGRLAMLLGIAEKLGNFRSTLQTEKEPYGGTLEFSEEWEAEDEEWKNQKMYDYACILLALIDNCGEIHWTYQVGEEAYTVDVDEAAADSYLPKPVKSYGESLESLQELLSRLM